MVKDLCFEVIQTCPNNCRFCSSCAGMDKDTMISYDTFIRTINHFMKIGGIEEISFSGGEPFLHPNLFDMIKYCKDLGIRVVLFTSGVRRNRQLTSEQMKELKERIVERYNSFKDLPEDKKNALIEKELSIYTHYNNRQFSAISRDEMEYLKHIGLDKIVFDFQGAERETYDYLMGSNHFDLVEQSIIRAAVVGLDTDIHFVPMKLNYKELPDLIEILNIAEIKNLSLLNFVPQGRGEINKEELMMNEDEILEFASIYERCKDSFNGVLRVGIPLLSDDKHKCTAGLDKLVIKYDGTVLPCPAFKEYDTSLLNKIGIKTPNVHTDLESVQVHNGTRAYPLCKKLYDFNGTIK
mgnify:FL=1